MPDPARLTKHYRSQRSGNPAPVWVRVLPNPERLRPDNNTTNTTRRHCRPCAMVGKTKTARPPMVATITRTTRPPWRVFFCPLSEAPPIGAGRKSNQKPKRNRNPIFAPRLSDLLSATFFSKKRPSFLSVSAVASSALGGVWVSAE